jgi:hypothetical protein
VQGPTAHTRTRAAICRGGLNVVVWRFGSRVDGLKLVGWKLVVHLRQADGDVVTDHVYQLLVALLEPERPPRRSGTS